jgi:AraC-like DNA-binding protein
MSLYDASTHTEKRSAAPSGAAMAHSHFSTRDHAPEQQLLAWRNRVGHIVDVPPTDTQLANGFSGEIDRYCVGGLVFTDARTDAMVLERSVARISVDKARDYVFHVVTQGETGNVTGMHRKRSASGTGSGILAFDLDQPFHVERPACRILSLFVPKAAVEAEFPDAESMHGRVVSHDSPLTRAILHQVVALNRELATMNSTEATGALEACSQLLVAAFRKQSRLSDGARAAARVLMLSQVRRYVEANLHLQELSPSSVVEALQLPRATLYRGFEDKGGLGAYIRNRRLREAAADLVKYPHLQVIDIAYGLGFKSASDFTRAFRRAYGMSPQDMRAQAFELQRTRDHWVHPADSDRLDHLDHSGHPGRRASSIPSMQNARSGK